jgi:hypothetical protein
MLTVPHVLYGLTFGAVVVLRRLFRGPPPAKPSPARLTIV